MDISYVIIDDEKNNIENLENLLKNWCPGMQLKGYAQNVADGVKLIGTVNPDLVFLDIQMPEKTGFDLLKALEPVCFEVIFVTAFDQYGIQAIKFSALDYLLKPIDVNELQLAVEKAREKLRSKQANGNISNLLEYLRTTGKEPPRIALPTAQETRYAPLNQILRCEASDNYTWFFLTTGESVLVCKTLKEFTELLSPYNFIRTHQSHLVNTRYIKSLLKEDGGILLLDNGSRVPISRPNLDNVKKALAML
ncbi:LytR/AlgR family response regulator transcription factor [Sediminibacterium ginsengisoli]|uniref:Two component transcriptional regulator, LytTR family n=1 Tax=Sediminibacterium ginsengisoli TaxID=413434 RepID=A0A1T4R1H5_9BACT|nr:LytTR family DNA-binding domain-containing protein [Sediminibacterium ginsengisoli]SKA09737.1 two component transcriptional regulator, LytTR family [Sediminibacterium ginsengisoli]